MIDYALGTYDFEDSLRIPFWRQLSIGECIVLAEGEHEQEQQTASEQESFEREMLLRRLGSTPTDYPRSIGAADFAGMLDDLHSAKSMSAKVRTLQTWSNFFHGTLKSEILALAEALAEGDNEEACRLIARICNAA